MNNLFKGLSLLLLFALAGCASGPQAKKASPEEQHQAAVYDMLIASPLPDLFIGGIKKGFEKHSTTPEKKAMFDCTVTKMTRPVVARAYTDVSMGLFTEEEASGLGAYMRSKEGKHGAAQILSDKLGTPSAYPPQTDAEKKKYGMRTLSFWVKVPKIMKDQKAESDLKVTLIQSMAACKK